MQHTSWRLLKLMAPFRWWLGLAALLGFATIGSSVGLMATSAYMISKAALASSIADLSIAIVGVRFFGIARGLFRYLERYVSHLATFRLLARLRVWFYAAVEPLAPARLQQERSGDLLTRVVADIETLEHFYVRVLVPPVVALLVAGLTFLLMAWFNLWLGVAMIGFMVLAGVVLPLVTRRLGQRPGTQLIATRAELNATLVDSIQGMADLLAFGQEARYRAEVQRLSHELTRGQERMASIRGMGNAFSGLLSSLASLCVLTLAIPLVSSGQLDGVFLALLALTAVASFEAVTPLALALQHLEGSLAAARRLFAIVDSQPLVAASAQPSPQPQHAGLELRELSFSYANEGQGAPFNPARPVLDRVSFRIVPGGRVAIVGPSGAGKSTLVNLLLRFWDYNVGQIWLGGHELRQYQPDDARRMVSVVAQHTHLFNGSIRDNLLVARPDASEADLVAAARQAQIHDFIQHLPQGYDTWIGEQGLRLSGGERQRLAIARALLKDAPFLILDEATAHLDALTERSVLQALEQLMAGRTTLIITHRLTGLEQVDEILVMQGGHIVERGRHATLLHAAGLYRRMWQLQHPELALAEERAA